MKKIESFALMSGVFVFALSILTHAQSATPSQSSLVRPRSVTAQQQQQQGIAPAASPTPTVNQTAPPVTATLPAPSSTTTPEATSVTTVPQILYVPAVPLKPAQPLAPNKARARITEAKASLKSRLVATGATCPRSIS